jgi:selenide,water dikinase
LSRLPKQQHPDLLVGIETGDDAAVFRLTKSLALVQTVDFFPPIVDDPYDFGAIAVANALSDIYAMGGTPITALNILCYPVDMDREPLAEILRGGYEKAAEAGVLIVGGHTIDDAEPKYGLSVTGVVKPGKQVTNAGAKPGDVLVLTKPLGTGAITTAAKNDKADPAVLRLAVQMMATLNHAASDAMVAVGVNACTDVTGFGLLGHLYGMVKGSGVGARVSLSAVPALPGARELIAAGIVPGGTERNFASIGKRVRWGRGLDKAAKLFLCDAQTSGGLLIAVPPARANALRRKLRASGVQTVATIGEITSGPLGEITVEP